jgi:hypothetical protein
VIYVLDGDTWTLALNFDKEREEKAGVDVYQRVASKTKTPAPSQPATGNRP